MDFFRGSTDRSGDGFHHLPFDRIIAEGVQFCPFLRNIGESTSFSFLPSSRLPAPVKSNQGPIFEDGPNFELAFKLFHGSNGVVPLSGRNQSTAKDTDSVMSKSEASNVQFHPLAASAAAISLSSLGAAGPFGFDAFMSRKMNMKKNNKPGKKEQRPDKKEQQSEKNSSADHQALGNEWLQTGNCPIAKSFRAVSGVLPLVAKIIQSPPGMKYHCPPAIVAARAALARTAAVKALRPQPLPARVLAVGLLGMALNVPLGIWREHTEKFSPAWFTAVHASVPFIAMLRKAVHMPKYAMAYTIAASILGQVIGSRSERKRLELVRMKADEPSSKIESEFLNQPFSSSSIVNEKVVPGEKFDAVFGDSAFANVCGKEQWSLSTKPRSSTNPLSVF